MIVSGATMPAAQLAGTRLFDRVIEGPLLPGALDFAREAATRRALPRVRDLIVTHTDAAGFLASARESVAAHYKNLPAPRACIEALAASLGPFDEGLVRERALFTHLVQSPESAAP